MVKLTFGFWIDDNEINDFILLIEYELLKFTPLFGIDIIQLLFVPFVVNAIQVEVVST